MTLFDDSNYVQNMDINTKHLDSCLPLVRDLLPDYLVGKAKFFAQHNYTAVEIRRVVAWEEEKARDGTNRHELMYEYAVKERLQAEHTSGSGSDLTFHSRHFFIKLELKTCGAYPKSDGRYRAEIDLKKAKADADYFGIGIFSPANNKTYYAVIPSSACRNTNGELNDSINIEFNGDGEPSTRKFKKYLYSSYEDHIKALVEIQTGDRSNSGDQVQSNAG